VILNPTAADIAAIRQEARQGVMKACANPESIEVFVEINPQTGRVRATAIGTMEMRSQEMCRILGPEECRPIAAQSMNLSPERVELRASTGLVHIYQGLVEEKRWKVFTSRRHPLRVIDNQGFVKVQRSDGSAFQLSGATALDGLKQAWENLTIYNGDSIIYLDLFLIVGSHIVDLSGVQSMEQAFGVVSTELEGVAEDQPVVVMGTRGQRGI